MPIVKKVMKNLKSEYGKDKGKSVYFAMENSGKLDSAKKAIISHSMGAKKWA